MSTDRAARRRQQRWEDIDSPATDHLLLLSGKLAVEGKQRVRRPAQRHSGPGVGDDGPKRAPLSLTGDLILSPPAVGLPAASPYTELARV